MYQCDRTELPNQMIYNLGNLVPLVKAVRWADLNRPWTWELGPTFNLTFANEKVSYSAQFAN